jgi:hypothetical protein
MLPIVASIEEISNTSDSYKIFLITPPTRDQVIPFLSGHGISTVNIGHELAGFIQTLESYEYLEIEVEDFLKKILDQKKTKLNGSENDITGIYNIGILLEPSLGLKADHLLKKISKSTAIIILWENEIKDDTYLSWQTQSEEYNFDFSDAHLKLFQHAV